MKRFASLGLLLLSAFTHLMPAHADTYPNKPVTLMVPYPPGGLSDVIARKVNQALAQELKQPVIIEKPGRCGRCHCCTKGIERTSRWVLHLSGFTQ